MPHQVFADDRTGNAREGGLVADLRKVVFRQTGHFHDGIAINAVLQHGKGNFQFACLQRIVKFIQPADGIQSLLSS